MQFDGALIREQGVTFGIIVVRRHVLTNPSQRDDTLRFGRAVWGPIPIVLMEQDRRGTPTYWGRPDIVDFLADVYLDSIPWKRYTVAA